MTSEATALTWLNSYHGSIDSTAVVLAHRAGQASATAANREALVAELGTIPHPATCAQEFDRYFPCNCWHATVKSTIERVTT